MANELLKKLVADLGGVYSLAAEMGIYPSTVWRWYDPKSRDGLPPIITLLRLADIAAKHKIYIDIDKLARDSGAWRKELKKKKPKKRKS